MQTGPNIPSSVRYAEVALEQKATGIADRRWNLAMPP